MRFGRLLTAMVTPFKADLSVDYGGAAELARYLIESGSEGLVVSGTTGESPTLATDEKLKLFEVVLEAVGDRAIVIAGTGSNSTSESVSLTCRAEAIGVHGAMAVVPYYNKPPQEGLYQHFRAIAESTKLPLMLYNVPGRTSCNLAAATTLRLAEIPNVVAVKEASGNLDQVAEIVKEAPDGFTVYSGDDSLTLPMMAIGSAGIISVAAHVAGRQMREMIDAFVSGRPGEAAAIHLRLMPVFKGLFATTNPILVKAALRLRGFEVGGLRPPLVEATEKESAALQEVIRQGGLI